MTQIVINGDLLTAIMTLIAIFAGSGFVLFKTKFSQLVRVLNDLDNMWADNVVTDAEWEKFWNDAMILIEKVPSQKR